MVQTLWGLYSCNTKIQLNDMPQMFQRSSQFFGVSEIKVRCFASKKCFSKFVCNIIQ